VTISSNELAALTLRSIVVHEIPHRLRSDEGGPVLSDAPSPLDDDVRVFFEERIRSTVAQGFAVQFTDAHDSPVPDLIVKLASKAAPVSSTKSMAEHLYAIQHGATSSGLLAVAQAKLGRAFGVAVIKLEREDGIRLEQTKVGGKKSFSLERIRDLMLTSSTRVFKTGLFVKRGKTLDEFDGVVSDSQRPRSDAVASFFLERFLGCELAAEPDVSTKAFLEGVERFINTDVVEADKQARYWVASLAELEAKASTIVPGSFAQSHIDEDDRDAFFDALRDAGAPTKRFQKDTSLVAPRLRKMRFTFVNGTQVIAPPSAVGDSVVVEQLDAGRAAIHVEGELKKLR